MPSKSANLKLNVNYSEEDKCKDWRDGIDQNFTIIDNAYKTLNDNVNKTITKTQAEEMLKNKPKTTRRGVRGGTKKTTKNTTKPRKA